MKAPRIELEREILEAPDDEERYRAYGEWLREQGDPRGEFCEVQTWLRNTERQHEARVAASENAQWAIDLAEVLDQPINWILEPESFSPLEKRLRQWEEDVYARGRRTREFALWDAHSAVWLAGLERKREQARLQIFRSSYRSGFLYGATIQDTLARGAAATFDTLRRHPEAVFLRQLDVAAPSYQPVVDALVRDAPPALRHLVLRHLGDSRRPCTLAPLYEKLPALTKLVVTLHRGPTDLGSLVLPELVSFALGAVAPLTKANLRSVTTAHWPKLKRLFVDFAASDAWLVPPPPQSLLSMARGLAETLLFYLSPDSRQHRPPWRFWLGETAWRCKQALTRMLSTRRHVDDDADGPCTLEGLGPVLDAQGIPELVWLELASAPSPDRLPELLARAKVLKQLRVLKLSVMGEAGARALLAHADAFRHLKVLELRFHLISPELAKELERLCDQVRVYCQTSDGWQQGRPEGEE